jgi:hypothetical protein
MTKLKKAIVYTSLECATYIGKSNTFESYITLHQKAHAELNRLNEPIADNKKVKDFLAGIHCVQLHYVKLFVVRSQINRNSFTRTSNYLTQVANIVPNYSDQK